MLGYLYCVRKKDLNLDRISLEVIGKYFLEDILSIEFYRREIIYANNYTLYQDKDIAREEFFNIYRRFQSECGYIVLPIKCYAVYNYYCALVEEINIDLTKNNNLNFKVWRRY